MLGARRAQLADLAALAARQERLRALAAQQRAAADVAGDVLLVGLDVAGPGHRRPVRVATGRPGSAGYAWTSSACAATFWARCAGISS